MDGEKVDRLATALLGATRAGRLSWEEVGLAEGRFEAQLDDDVVVLRSGATEEDGWPGMEFELTLRDRAGRVRDDHSVIVHSQEEEDELILAALWKVARASARQADAALDRLIERVSSLVR
jgi:hypothetical protein